MAKFKTWGPGELYTIVVALAMAVILMGAALVVVFTGQPLLGLWICLGIAVVCVLFAAGYYLSRRRKARNHKAYLDEFDCNVFCDDAETRARWHFGVRHYIEACFHDVGQTLKDPTCKYLSGLTIRIVSHPLKTKLTKNGLASGLYSHERSRIQLAWIPDWDMPFALPWELGRAVVARRDGLHGDEAAIVLKAAGI